MASDLSTIERYFVNELDKLSVVHRYPHPAQQCNPVNICPKFNIDSPRDAWFQFKQMRSRQISFRVTWKLYDELLTLSRQRGYKNLSRLMIGLSLKAIQDNKRRVWIPAIANADPKLQDYLINKVLEFPADMDEMLKMLKRLDGH